MPDGPVRAPILRSPQTVAASDKLAGGPLGVCVAEEDPYSGQEAQEGMLEVVWFKLGRSEPGNT